VINCKSATRPALGEKDQQCTRCEDRCNCVRATWLCYDANFNALYILQSDIITAPGGLTLGSVTNLLGPIIIIIIIRRRRRRRRNPAIARI